MKTVKELIQEKEIWAGLNHPNIALQEADVAVCGIPFDGGVSFRSGAKEAPKALREITYTIDPTTERFESIEELKVLDFGDIEGESREEIFKKVKQITYDCVKAGKLITFIGGDHSTTIPILWGIDQALEESFGIIHIDAHFDLCNEMGGDHLSHGSTERRALELKNIPDTESIYFLGIRSAEAEEAKFIRENKMNILGAREIRQLGIERVLEKVKGKMARFKKIYITIDIDALDPAYAPGTGTPQFGGLDGRELLDLLYGLFELPVIGFDVVEVAPNLEESKIALFAARKIITECWGHHWRKGMNIYGKYEKSS
ncbi:agmatinase [Geosporobacter ferrireducens]|uniref:Agmatinase n=1 Tax=Geosporobacter ferrireducens TaxID=1424294 RepID=A0A1D8GHY0_9FIRM|nr:agmatinase [Geosporobacter ferrireducens]AOT70507.1 agmatinase [Geosporobacter ferrireducens]MTI57138.1 agmatinase [Geosporobacter ferrireducens]